MRPRVPPDWDESDNVDVTMKRGQRSSAIGVVVELVWPAERQIGAIVRDKVASGLIGGRVTAAGAGDATVVALETGTIATARTGEDAANDIHPDSPSVPTSALATGGAPLRYVYDYTDITIQCQYFMSILL